MTRRVGRPGNGRGWRILVDNKSIETGKEDLKENDNNQSDDDANKESHGRLKPIDEGGEEHSEDHHDDGADDTARDCCVLFHNSSNTDETTGTESISSATIQALVQGDLLSSASSPSTTSKAALSATSPGVFFSSQSQQSEASSFPNFPRGSSQNARLPTVRRNKTFGRKKKCATTG